MPVTWTGLAAGRGRRGHRRTITDSGDQAQALTRLAAAIA
jgi:hypothetical protein